MYSLVSDSIEYADGTNCLQGGIVLRQQQKPQLVKVYPNPAYGQATVAYQLPDETAGVLVLYNGMGQQVKQVSLAAAANTQEFSTAGMAEGMYYYTVYSSGAVIGSGKLAIIR